MERRIKNRCGSCGKEILNSPKRYNRSGNYCNDCITRAEYMFRWRMIKNKKKELNEADEDELARLKEIIQNRWGIDMEDDNKRFKEFRSRFFDLFEE